MPFSLLEPSTACKDKGNCGRAKEPFAGKFADGVGLMEPRFAEFARLTVPALAVRHALLYPGAAASAWHFGPTQIFLMRAHVVKLYVLCTHIVITR